MRWANARNLPASKVLRLPWEPWCETDIDLGMAADLHDRLLCPCGCGKWEKDAHNPDLKDSWQVDSETCYVRRAISAYEQKWEPGPDDVVSVRLVLNPVEAARSEYEALLARHPSLAAGKPQAEPNDQRAEREQGQ